jgi:DNA-binding winged helix-turn-helix (wHTH) protein/Tol biopolymer transport system component
MTQDGASAPVGIYTFGAFCLDPQRGLFTSDGNAVPLTPKAMLILCILVESHGRIVEKNDLMEKAWPQTFVEESNLTFNIHQIRQTLGEWNDGNRYIETVPRRGYRFVAPVTVHGAERDKVVSATGVAQLKAPGIGRDETPASDSRPAGGVAEVTVQPVLRPGVGVDSEPFPGPISLGQAPHQAPGSESRALGAEQQVQVRKPRRKWWPTVIVGLAAAALVTGFIVWVDSPRPLPEAGNDRQLTHDRREKYGPLLTDGVRLYFCEAAPQGCALTSVPATGGETVPVPAPFPSITLFDISPDCSRLLIGSPVSIDKEVPLWIMPIGGGQPQPVDGVLARAAAWSHGGSRIAYINGSGLYTASIDGTGVHKTADVGVDAGQIRWSPDDTWLRFVESSGNPPIARPWEVRADGTALRSILSDWGHLTGQFYGDWLANGRYYVFSIQEERGVPRIIRLWVMPEKASLFGRGSSAPVRLGDDTRGFGWPVSSRDGRKLFVIGTEQSGELVRYDAREQEFVPYLNGVEARWVTFSPDRKWVAFTPYDDGTLWVVHPNGSGRTQLTFGPMYADGFAWSPDGRWIAIHALRTPKAKYKINLIPAPKADAPVEPAQPEALLPGDQEIEGIPSWSPDGRSIAFAEMDGPTSDQGSGNEVIHICDLASRQVSKLTGKKGVWTARWSPDGRYLAALTNDVRQRLELYDIKTQTWRDSGAEHINNPTWSHDSKYIYYDTQGSAPDEGIYRVRISDGKVELAAPYHGIRRADETWSGLAPDDSPIVLRDVGIQEIYALDVKWP